ncbi:hypothetical protein B0H16DRAFT_1521760 [Mycena metata]|uniref:Uncharacterized protein n=1 Tax=Mycena metata TaxID=1033252 RepID=A0AAD7JLW6_9AGAR|nr:hypothetical protein B0H16DRAFT_1521760 [Mycena metata]
MSPALSPFVVSFPLPVPSRYYFYHGPKGNSAGSAVEGPRCMSTCPMPGPGIQHLLRPSYDPFLRIILSSPSYYSFFPIASSPPSLLCLELGNAVYLLPTFASFPPSFLACATALFLPCSHSFFRLDTHSPFPFFVPFLSSLIPSFPLHRESGRDVVCFVLPSFTSFVCFWRLPSFYHRVSAPRSLPRPRYLGTGLGRYPVGLPSPAHGAREFSVPCVLDYFLPSSCPIIPLSTFSSCQYLFRRIIPY